MSYFSRHDNLQFYTLEMKPSACGISEMVIYIKALHNHVITVEELYKVSDK